MPYMFTFTFIIFNNLKVGKEDLKFEQLSWKLLPQIVKLIDMLQFNKKTLKDIL